MAHTLRQEYLISYDVADTKSRTRVYKELIQYGMFAVQKSVFWGYLTIAELHSVQRYLSEKLQTSDKAFIVHSNFNGRGQCFLIGHQLSEFADWEENGVI